MRERAEKRKQRSTQRTESKSDKTKLSSTPEESKSVRVPKLRLTPSTTGDWKQREMSLEVRREWTFGNEGNVQSGGQILVLLLTVVFK